jgi:hypothetical protein
MFGDARGFACGGAFGRTTDFAGTFFGRVEDEGGGGSVGFVELDFGKLAFNRTFGNGSDGRSRKIVRGTNRSRRQFLCNGFPGGRSILIFSTIAVGEQGRTS